MNTARLYYRHTQVVVYNRATISHRYRYRCLTSLNITQMISDNWISGVGCFCRDFPRCSRRVAARTLEDQGQTDHVTALPRPHALDSSSAAAGLGRAAPHASPRFNDAVSQYSTLTYPLTLTYDSDFQSQATHIQKLKFKCQSIYKIEWKPAYGRT